MRTFGVGVLALASILVFHLVFPVSWAGLITEPLNDQIYANIEDLNIGGIFSITARDDDRPCSDRIEKFYQVVVAEMMVYAIQEINKLLTTFDIKIGYVITDACDKETTAAIQALRFLPQPSDECENDTEPEDPNILQTFKVIGVVGTDQSFTSKPVSLVLNTAKIPLVSFWASDISLSDKMLYPNFKRVIYSDDLIVHAMITFITSNNFTYVTVIYEEDLPMMDLFSELLDQQSDKELCMPMEMEVKRHDNFEKIVDHVLHDDLDPRVVVVLAHDEISEKIIRAVMKAKTEGKIMWLGGDSWMHIMIYLGGPKGSLTVSYEAAGNKTTDFEQYFRNLDLNTSNPWFKKGMEVDYKCTTNECIRETMPTIQFQMGLSLVYDAVMVYGRALLEFFTANCSGFRKDSALACFHNNTDLFQTYLKIKPGSSRDTISVNDRSNDWHMTVYQSEGEKGKLTELQDLDLSNQNSTVTNPINTNLFTFDKSKLNPETFCTPQCKFGEYRFYLSKCCWKCKKCKENAIVSNNIECVPCPELYWPQLFEETTVLCVEIPPHQMSISGKFHMFLFIMSMLGVSTVLGTLAWYRRNRDNELVKASSIELSCAQLLALSCGYLGVPVILSRPSNFSCPLGIMMITLSFNILYAIVLFKAIRVHRIFSLSKKNARIAYTSQRFQIVSCLGFLVFEVSRFYIANHFNPIAVNVFQPDQEVRYTEEACSVPIIRMFLFLVFNLILLLACCVLAFKTQTLPTRFRESRYVAMCVITTIVIISALTPAYFTTVRRQTRAELLVFALLVNHTTAYIFLFLTRIVAVETIKRSRRRAAVMKTRIPKRHQVMLKRLTEGDVHSKSVMTRKLKG